MAARLKPYDQAPLVPQISDTSRAGTVVKIRNERGTYKVVEEVLAECGAEWVLLHGGPAGKTCFRHVYPWRVVWPTPKRVKKEQS